MSANFNAVIFDCDGVLFDSLQSNIDFYNHILEKFGLPPMDEATISYIHMATSEQSVTHAFRNSPHLEPCAQEYRLRMDYTPFIDKLQLEDGLIELLKTLYGHIKLAVATNRSNTAVDILKRFDIAKFFEFIITILDVKKPKPDPEGLLFIAENFRLPKKKILYVGDSIIDSLTAQAAGISFAAYKNTDIAADFHISSMADIIPIVMN